MSSPRRQLNFIYRPVLNMHKNKFTMLINETAIKCSTI